MDRQASPRKQQAQAGFSVVEVALILVILGLLGMSGWYVYHSQRATRKAQSSTSSHTTTDPYAGWKTYTSQDEKFSVRYPGNWEFGIQEAPDGNLSEQMSIISPHNFILTYSLVKYDPAATITEEQQEATVHGDDDPLTVDAYSVVSSFTPRNFTQPLHIVINSSDTGDQGGPINSLGLSAYQSYQDQPLGYAAYYLSQNLSGYIVQWYGGFSKAPPSAGPVGMEPTAFLATSDVKTAILVMKSMSYPTSK